MNTDNVLMHNTDMEREGGLIRRKTERCILQTRLFLDRKWGKEQCGLLSANEQQDDKSGRRGEGRGGGGGGG